MIIKATSQVGPLNNSQAFGGGGGGEEKILAYREVDPTQRF